MHGMDTDVTQNGRQSRACRVGAPLGLLLPVGIDGLRQPVLHVFRVDPPHLAQCPAGDHFPHLPHHRVAGIG